MPFFYYFDTYYWIILVPAMLIALLAQINVSSTFNRYSRIASRRGLTGAQAAEEVLKAHGVYGVRITQVSGKLTDHYDPRTNTIRLSDAVYGSTSIASVGVAAHEAGHAVQYAQEYGPIKLRGAIIPVCNFSSQISILLIILGFAMYSRPLFAVGVVLFSVATFFQVVTLPVEFNASRRAIQSLQDTHMLDDQELRGAKKVLGAAAMTYVAALLVSIAQLLRYILAFNSRRRD
ncbi:MAG: zinc metallopeptidase [Clostridiales bacterium]|uniref:zinc metallopeptidase n=1 Tax=Flavonifractor porci TaxID=3133422 RepID=UPI0030A5B927|nr:zinc metallopeptidase [Clostridiales bacterium]